MRSSSFGVAVVATVSLLSPVRQGPAAVPSIGIPLSLAEAITEATADGLTSDPSAVSWGSGRIDVFARGADNALWHRWYAGSWSAWESLGGALSSGPDASSWGSGRLDVFARAKDNSLQHMSYEGKWSGWESLGGGLTSDPSAVSWASGRIDVFVRGGDNALWHISYAKAWSGWESLGGGLASGPDASSWGAGRLDVFAQGGDNTLYHLWYSGGWSAWEGLGAPTTTVATTTYTKPTTFTRSTTLTASVPPPAPPTGYVKSGGLALSPPPPAPTGFAARHLGNGAVAFSWQTVSGATQYRLDGPGIPSSGLLVTATSANVSNVPGGPGTWQIVSVPASGLSDPNLNAKASAMVRYLPAHPVMWLTKNNGPGSWELMALHYGKLCNPSGFWDCWNQLKATVSSELWGLDPEKPELIQEAVYGNVNDLGTGRRTNCIQKMKGPPTPGLFIVCYATNHGYGPGEAGFGNPAVMTRAAAGEDPPPLPRSAECGSSFPCFKNPWGSLPRGASVMVKDPLGMRFLTMNGGKHFLNADAREREDWMNMLTAPGWWTEKPKEQETAILDSEGPKYPPHACMSCHGGVWDPSTLRVQGASFLPLDPNLLVFGATQAGDRTRYERPYQEENLRRINAIILNSGPSPAVADYIKGLYPYGVWNAGRTAQSDYVPAGWRDQPGLYRQVVRPYCTMCHLAGPSNLSFTSWGNFLQNKALIYTAVCQQKTMPHAEIPFREFWTRDTGPLYLPGLLAVSLGYQNCP